MSHKTQAQPSRVTPSSILSCTSCTDLENIKNAVVCFFCFFFFQEGAVGDNIVAGSQLDENGLNWKSQITQHVNKNSVGGKIL